MAEPIQIDLPSDTILDAVPARALKFFGAVSKNPYIRAVLEQRGYSEAIHQRGWGLVLKAAGFRGEAATALGKPEATAAMAELDAWDEPNFRVARAALLPMPAQLHYVFENLEAQKGAGAVASVTTFLDRLDGLESTNKERKATRKADQAALDKLGDKRIGPDERVRLRGLLVTATGSPGAAALQLAAGLDTEKEAARLADERAAKIELWLLLTEWTETAKADITRRDYLIQLGIAKRKVKAKKGESTGGEG